MYSTVNLLLLAHNRPVNEGSHADERNANRLSRPYDTDTQQSGDFPGADGSNSKTDSDRKATPMAALETRLVSSEACEDRPDVVVDRWMTLD